MLAFKIRELEASGTTLRLARETGNVEDGFVVETVDVEINIAEVVSGLLRLLEKIVENRVEVNWFDTQASFGIDVVTIVDVVDDGNKKCRSEQRNAVTTRMRHRSRIKMRCIVDNDNCAEVNS